MARTGGGEGGRRPWIAAAYRLFLRLFPGDFRRRYGDEMARFFEAEWAEARGFGRVRVLWRALRGAVVHGSLERAGIGQRSRPGRWTMTEGLTRDLMHALRGLRRNPTFSGVAVLTVALGIGAASAVFAVVDAVVFRPVPYPEPDRLVATWTRFEGQGDFPLSQVEMYDWAAESRAFESMGSFLIDQPTLTGLGEARNVTRAWTWGDLYGVIGAHVSQGRLPGPEDAHTGATPVTVVSHDFWQDALGGRSDVVGSTLEIDGRPIEIIGVMEPGVRTPTRAVDMWRPVARDRADIRDRSGHGYEGIARLAPGASMETVSAEIDEIHSRCAPPGSIRWRR